MRRIRTYDLFRPGVPERRPVGTGSRRSPVAARRFPAVAGVRPSGADAPSVVERAAAARRHRLRNDPRYEGFTEAALAERVVGLPVGAKLGHGGWQLVG